MKEAAWMAGGSFAAWLVALMATGGDFRAEMLLGMLCPLAVACVTWVMAERVYVRNPRALTGLMIAAFAFKLVFFGGYVAVMLRGLRVRPVPFAVSFSSYFIALHFVEAWLLSRLFAGPRG
jgi:branched-subunit amino acid ABC-type transport system permease component